MGAKGIEIIFGGGVYVAENTSHGASVELAAFFAASEAQSEVLVSIGRSCGRVDFIVKKRRRGLFLTYAERPDFRAFCV